MIKGLFQFIFGLIRLAFFVAILALIFHTWAIRQLLGLSLSYVLGADVSIQEVKMDWKNTGFEAHGIEIGNPYSFPKDRMARIPLLIISVDVPAIAQGRAHLKTVGFNLQELQVMNAPRQGLNVLALKPLQKAKESEGPSPSGRGGFFSIDELIFSVGELVYLDMTSGSVKRNVFRAGIRGATYYDIQGTEDVVVIVATEALKKMGFSYLNTQLQKLQDRYLSKTVNYGNFFSRAVTAIRDKISSE